MQARCDLHIASLAEYGILSQVGYRNLVLLFAVTCHVLVRLANSIEFKFSQRLMFVRIAMRTPIIIINIHFLSYV